MKLKDIALFEEATYIPYDQLLELERYKFIAPCFYFVSPNGDESDWCGNLALITDIPKNISLEKCKKLFELAGCPYWWAEDVLYGEWRQYILEPGAGYGSCLVQDMTFHQWVDNELSYYNEAGDFEDE